MAKERGKKIKRKGKKIGQANGKIKKLKAPKVCPTETIDPARPVPLSHPGEITASEPDNNNGGASPGIQKEGEKLKRLSGFIFMCNSGTKLECYQYRVFGLPSGKKEVVEEIKPGTKLFLFDFEKKLLYGIYAATSAGKLNLEPAAFRGNFPAQVKFKIFKECLPLPESSLRHVIKENYKGLKFKQELSGKQVRKLISSFRPLTVSSSQPTSQALPNVQLSQALPPSVPYLAQHRRLPPIVEQHSVPRVNFLQHGYHRAAAYVEHLNPTLDHRSLPATSSFYVANSQRPPFTECVACGVQEPPYLRTMEERPSYDQITSSGMRYRTVEERAPQDQVSILGRHHHHHQLPLQGEALHQDNMAAYNLNPTAPAQYTSSAFKARGPAPYHQLPLQRGAQCQDSVIAYNSNPAAGPQYTASVSRPQAPATYYQLPLQREALCRDNVVAYNLYSAASARFSSSVMQPQVAAPGISHGTDPMSSYYSYTAANHLSR